MSMIEPQRTPAADLTLTTFENAEIPLYDLFKAATTDTQRIITGKTFRNCLLTGPVVLLAVEGVRLDGCDLGVAEGDMRILVLRPASPRKVTGAIPFSNCTFENCRFFGVGFTGGEGFVNALLAVKGREPEGGTA